MSDELMNTKEVAHYLGIHEKQVYALIGLKRIPATKITGKWVFPRKLIDEWIESNARSGLEQAREKSKRAGDALLASGSNDVILDLLQSHARRKYPEFYLFPRAQGARRGSRPSTRAIRTSPGRTCSTRNRASITSPSSLSTCPTSTRSW